MSPATSLAAPVRPARQIAPPTRLERAFADPEAVLALVRAGAPYRTQEAVHRHPGVSRTGGWFRNFWALGGKVVFEGAAPFLHNPIFLEAARESFGAEVVRPVAMMTNLNLPMAGLPPHLDLPFFRGAMNREVPAWLLAPMGYSGLFHEWAVPVASAITWFYDGEGGEFEYWPEGLGAPSRTERPPYANRAVMADNEYMWHRVGPLGREAEHVPADGVPFEAVLALGEGGRWEVRHEGRVLSDWDFGAVRVSVLWKAYCFGTEAEAAAYDSGEGRLTPERIVELFLADLKARGEDAARPEDPFGDAAFKARLERVYAPPPAPGA